MAILKRLFGAGSQSENDLSKALSGQESAASLNIPHTESVNNTELVAVIMASLMAMLNPGAESDLKIRSIKRIGRNAPVWNIAGRDEYIASKL